MTNRKTQLTAIHSNGDELSQTISRPRRPFLRPLASSSLLTALVTLPALGAESLSTDSAIEANPKLDDGAASPAPSTLQAAADPTSTSAPQTVPSTPTTQASPSSGVPAVEPSTASAPAPAPTATPAPAPTATPAPAPTATPAPAADIPPPAPPATVPAPAPAAVPAPAPAPAGTTVAPSGQSAPAKPATTGPDRSGVGLFTATNALWGGYALGTLGNFGSRTDVSVPLGIGAGMILGAGSTLLFTLDKEVTSRQATYYALSELWGGATGWVAASTMIPRDDVDVAENTALIRVRSTVGPVGMGVGLLMASRQDKANYSTLNWAGSAATLGTWGMGLLWDPQTPETRLAGTLVTTGLGLAELGLGLKLGSGTTLSNNDNYLMLHGLAHSGLYGFFLPYLVEPYPESKQIVGGGMSAISVGVLGTRLLAERVEWTPREVNGVSFAGLSGQALGAGIPMMLGALNDTDEDRFGILQTNVGMAAGHTLGLALGAARHTRFESSPSLGTTMTLGAGLGVVHAVGLGYSFLDDGTLTSSQFAGLTLASAGVGGLASSFITPKKRDNSRERSLITLTTMTWGALYGAWTGMIADVPTSRVLTYATVGTDVGVASGLLLSEKLKVSPIRYGYASLCGIAGAVVGDLVSLSISDNGRVQGAAFMAGASVGLGVGAATSGLLPASVLRKDTGLRAPRKAEAMLDSVRAWDPMVSVGPLVYNGPVSRKVFADVDNSSEVPMGVSLQLTQPVRF